VTAIGSELCQKSGSISRGLSGVPPSPGNSLRKRGRQRQGDYGRSGSRGVAPAVAKLLRAAQSAEHVQPPDHGVPEMHRRLSYTPLILSTSSIGRRSLRHPFTGLSLSS
jgi:hypothetical protein